MRKTENKYLIYDTPRDINCKYYIKKIISIVRHGVYKAKLNCIKVVQEQKKYKVSLCAIFKNEGPYLKEWIEYHRIIGVEHIYLYNNFSEDDYKTILQPYVEEGFVTLAEWPVKQGQLAAYTHCIENYKQDTNWIGFIDLDEFIVPIKDNNIQDFLVKFSNRPTVKLYWNVFGTSGRIDRDRSGLVTEDFVLCWRKMDEVGKCIYNTSFDFDPNCRQNGGFLHMMWGQYKKKNLPPVNCFDHICGDGFEKVDSEEFPIVINHYFTKSFREFMGKVSRGDAVFAENPRNLDYFYRHDMLCGKSDYHIYKYLIKLKRAMQSKEKDEK